MVLNVVRELLERHRLTEKIRKQMRMSKRCGKELDILLGLLGIDYSTLELCPVPAEKEESTKR